MSHPKSIAQSTTWTFAPLAFVMILLTWPVSDIGQAADDARDASKQEQALLAVLSSDAPAAEKAITCKLLAIHGSDVAVPDLAQLLSDPELASWARIALEAIPGERSDEALRKAAESLDGRLLVGTLNTIGVRRDPAAVEMLTSRLEDEDYAVASAAAVALGKIGNPAATEALREALVSASPEVRSAVAEGCVLCAERLLSAGESAAAAEIYDEVRAAEVPKQRIIEATRGAILARGDDGIPLLLEQLRSADKDFFHLGLGTAREMSGNSIDRALAAELRSAAPDRAALIVTAMVDRPKTIILDSIIQAAENAATPLRLAAIDGLGRVGDASSLAVLMDAALDQDETIAQAARSALETLGGQAVDQRLVTLVREAQAKHAGRSGQAASEKAVRYSLLLELVGQRRIAAKAELMSALQDSRATVRAAALKALGETVSLEELPILIEQFLSPAYATDAEAAGQALRAASIRMPDREASARQLAQALDKAPDASRVFLLEILAEMGGTSALQTVAAAANSTDPQQQDAGSRLLGKWNSVEAAPVLLELARSSPVSKYQVRALRGYLGLARKFEMPEEERVSMCRQALDLAQRDAERELALDVLRIHPSIEGLQLALEVANEPGLKRAATEAALDIAAKIRGRKAAIRKLLSEAGLTVDWKS